MLPGGLVGFPHVQMLADPQTHELTVTRRLLSGACAGMTATALTHPLDTMRLRLALPNHPYKGDMVEPHVRPMYRS